jgi:hypothetical protein
VIKREAFELAKRFIEVKPHLAHRPVRIAAPPPDDPEAVVELYVVRHGPRGGMQKSRLVGSEQDGVIIHELQSGVVMMRKEIHNGWPVYDSRPVLPHMESAAHSGHTWEREFTLAEKVESARWALEHNVYEEPHEGERILNALREQRAVEEELADLESTMRASGVL